jgi:hypothetical protein
LGALVMSTIVPNKSRCDSVVVEKYVSSPRGAKKFVIPVKAGIHGRSGSRPSRV